MKLYNLSRKDHLIEYFRISVRRYLDYKRYHDMLDLINGFVDQRENHEAAQSAIRLFHQLGKADEQITKAIHGLQKTTGNFSTFKEEAESQCRILLQQVLNLDGAAVEYLFGEHVKWSETLVDEVFTHIHELDYQYNQDAFNAFTDHIKTQYRKLSA